ncbi:MAG TPA: AAA family ATPase [Gaiellaceae bacterium]|jgi:DNA-binding CsgD family transcriptional regulator
MNGIVGRDGELDSLRAFVDAHDSPRALVLEGDAGIGKSTLWLAGVEHARSQGWRVLSSRPVEAEHSLGYVGLSDLLEPVLSEVLPGLTAPRRRALEVALLLEEADDEAVDPRALGTATRSALQLLAAERPVLVSIDDLQWLDASSAAVLAFALRRLAGSELLLLLTRRLSGAAEPSQLERALGEERVRRLRVGPLSIGALHRFLRDRLGRPFARQTLVRIHERSRGNPFFALELAGLLDEEIDPLAPLSVPETIEDLLRARLAGLPAATREALSLASAWGTTSESLLERAGVTAGALEPALAARVVDREDGLIRFTHPLLASVLYADLGEERRSLHGRIAAIVDDPLLRARHLALSTRSPDADVAAALDDAAGLATARGSSAVAAELADQALRLTPPEVHSERHRRALAAARAYHAAGEWTRAGAIASDLLAETESGPLRAEVLVLLAELGSVDDAVALLDEALREPGVRPALSSIIHYRLAWAARFREGYVRALEHARVAYRLAQGVDDEVLRERARVVQAVVGWMVGDPEASDLSAGAHELAAALGGERFVQEATFAVVSTLVSSRRIEEARALLERDHRVWRDRDEQRSARSLWNLSWVEFWAGRWQLAAAHADAAHDISIQYGIEVPQDHLPIAVIAVHRGELELAREHSERALALAEEQFGLHPPQHLAVLGLVALWSGDASVAADRLAEAEERAQALGWGEPSLRWWTADHVELLLELGRNDDAARLLETWEEDAARLGRDWVLAHAARCRGLAAAASGDVEQAALLLEEAVARHEAVGDPFGRSRALLALGVVRRRARRKRPARDAIDAALAGFEALGADCWAARARAEVGRVGGRTREEGLTAAERRVAVLVAEGRTNREVAAALFLTERTVASHLTHVYAKLGVRSRTQLAHRLDADESE